MVEVDFQHAWAAALEELELDVAAAEALLRSGHVDPPATVPADWQPPSGLGPLPEQLRERAAAVLRRQAAAAEQLARTIGTNRQQAAFAARLETGRAARRPAYVDRAL